jgi:pimeloyl-ACP methyl ester carboxylesterase
MTRRSIPLCIAACALVVVVSCKKKEPAAEQASSAPKPVASASVAEAPSEPPTPGKDVTFESEEGVPLYGKFYLATTVPDAPILIFVHRFRGDKTEWAPAVERLAASKKRYTILNFDLRGHGASKSTEKKKRIDWADMKNKDMPALVRDIHAAIAFAMEHTNKLARGVVLVGSSLGAALAAKAAGEDAKVMAIALVSPGASINGFDVYHPFADVRQLPSFIASAKEDNVAREPVQALTKMAGTNAIVKTYDGPGHGAFGLLQAKAPLVDDLEAWLMDVYDKKPIERPIAEIKETSKSKKAHGR